jgi:hypothetical protein
MKENKLDGEAIELSVDCSLFLPRVESGAAAGKD